MSLSASKKVFVALSGGVDSSVAAALLSSKGGFTSGGKEQGYEVVGVHMLCWDGCDNNQDKQDAMRVAAVLDIPFEVWDFRHEYKKGVFDYMVQEYRNGRTPNPDVMCNKEIKFGIFLQRALEAGADSIATGHYVKKLVEDGGKGGVILSRAKDPNKDQTYFLWTLTQDQLRHCLFPIGDYCKSEVRALAKKFGLPTAEKKDSQGLCFVGKVDFGAFLREALAHPVDKPGIAVRTDGAVVGHHDGVYYYTVGQRHGLGIGGFSEPLYVAEKNIATNTLILAHGDHDPALYSKELLARNVHWIGEAPIFPLSCQARIRYRQPLQEVVLTSPPVPLSVGRGEKNIEQHTPPPYEGVVGGGLRGGEVFVTFAQSQRAVAPGQSVVFYQGDKMLGGAIIDSATSKC